MQKWIRNLTVEKYLSSLKIDLKLNKQTKIASIGSCFAREIRQYLLKNKFNYMLTEQGKNPWVKMDANYRPNQHGSAAWDRVFNTFTLRYIIDSTFGMTDSHRFLKIKDGVADVFRTRVVYPDMQTAKEDVVLHKQASRDIFTKADVLIVTLGLTEVWRLGSFTLPYLPEYKHRSELVFHKSGYTENLENLILGLRILRYRNPKLKILLTLSPIHMNSTFRDDVDVFSASCASKSILRAVIDAICQVEQGIYYFPSYEITTILCSELGVRQYRDGHHISPEAFAIITEAFETLIVK